MNAKPIIAFVSGLVLGAGGCAIYFKKKHNDILNKELADLHKMYTQKQKEREKQEPKVKEPAKEEKKEEDMNVMEYARKARSYNATDYTKTTMSQRDIIRPIPPDQRGEMTEYNEYELVLYEDGVLCGKKDDRIYDMNELFPTDMLSFMGGYEANMLYIVNDDAECYYIVEEDPRTYEEAHPRKPHQIGG